MELQALTAQVKRQTMRASAGPSAEAPAPSTAEAPVDPVPMPDAEVVEDAVESVPLAIGAKVKCGDLSGEVVEVLPSQIGYRVKVGDKEYSFSAAGVVVDESTPEAPAEEVDMSIVAQALGLAADATKEQMVEAINAQKAKATAAEASLKVAALKAAGCQGDLTDLLASAMPDATEASVEALKASRPSAFVRAAAPVQVTEPVAPLKIAAKVPEIGALAQKAGAKFVNENNGRTSRY